MITYEQLKNNIYDWAYSVDGGTIIWANDNGPKPDTPMITMEIQGFVPIGQPYTSKQNESTLNVKILQANEMSLILNAYGTNAAMRLYKFSVSNMMYPLADALRTSSGLSLLRSDTIRDLTGLNDTRKELRFSVELHFSCTLVLNNVNYGSIEYVNMSTKYNEKTGTLNIEL